MIETIVIGGLVAAKFILPLLLIPFPFLAGWANFALDSIDGDLLIPMGLADPVYQLIDKSADYVTYICMVAAAWRWPLRRVVLTLFVLRTVGQALFFITGNEFVFFIFPNFLEPLFLVYATILFFRRDDAWEFFKRHAVAISFLVFAYKMQDEYFTHVANIDRTELIGRLFGG